MATIAQISPSDNATNAAAKMNANFQNLNEAIGQGGGGGGTATSDIISRNPDGIARLYAAKKHVAESLHSGVQNSYNNFCICHGSDFHTDKTRWESFLHFAKQIDGINLIVNTGDNTAQGRTNGAEELAYMMDVLDDANITKPFLQVAGNHDRYSLTSAQVATAFKLQERGYRADNNNCYFYYDVNNNNNWDGNGTYNYADKPTPNISKFRFIVLNQYDFASTDPNVVGVGNHFSQEQITWFINVLANTPSTTAVIVCMHAADGPNDPLNTGNKAFYERHRIWIPTTAYTGTIIEDIIEAFRTGVNINKTFSISNVGDVTAQTSFTSTGTFIAYLIGHNHDEKIGYSAYHPNQLYLQCPCSCLMPDYNNDGVLFGSGRQSYGNHAGDMPRVAGTKTEDCFNIYGIDTINKVVKVVRIGSDVNDLGQVRQMDFYPYEQAPNND